MINLNEMQKALGIRFCVGLSEHEMVQTVDVIGRLRVSRLAVMPILRKGQRRVAVTLIQDLTNNRAGGGPILCYLDHKDDDVQPIDEKQTVVTWLDIEQEDTGK